MLTRPAPLQHSISCGVWSVWSVWSTDGSVVEFSPATREARVRFPVSAKNIFFFPPLHPLPLPFLHTCTYAPSTLFPFLFQYIYLILGIPCHTIGIRLLEKQLLCGQIVDRKSSNVIHHCQLVTAAGGKTQHTTTVTYTLYHVIWKCVHNTIW